MKLKDYMNSYINDKEIFDLQQRHATESDTFTSNKNFFSNQIVNLFMFTFIISIITIMLVACLFCKHKHIRTIVASLILHKIKEVEANSDHNPEVNNCEYRTLVHVGVILTVFSMIIVMFLHYRKIKNMQRLKIFKCHQNNAIYFRCTLKSKDIKLNRNYIWDTLEINWNKIIITLNDNKIDLPKIVAIKMRDKFRVRRLMNREPLNLHVMIRQGITWYNLETEVETV